MQSYLKESTNSGELTIYRKPTPLILFNPCSKTDTSQASQINQSFVKIIQGKVYFHDVEVQTECTLMNRYVQTDLENICYFKNESDIKYENTNPESSPVPLTKDELIDEQLGNVTEDDVLKKPESFTTALSKTLAPLKFSFLSSIQRFQLLPYMHVPTSTFSPMATLLTPMGNNDIFSGSKFAQESI